MDEATSNTSLVVRRLSTTKDSYCVNIVAPVYHFLQWINSPNDNDIKILSVEVLNGSIHQPKLPGIEEESNFYGCVLHPAQDLYADLVSNHDWPPMRAASVLPMCTMLKWNEVGNIKAAYSRHNSLVRSTPGVAELTILFKEAINANRNS